jgi:hypothetical protein
MWRVSGRTTRSTGERRRTAWRIVGLTPARFWLARCLDGRSPLKAHQATGIELATMADAVQTTKDMSLLLSDRLST